jgi:uncharacterized protein
MVDRDCSEAISARQGVLTQDGSNITARISTRIERQPVLAFYVLAFAITWLGWIPQAAHSHGLFPFDNPLFYVLCGVGPMLAAFIVLRLLRGKEAYQELFGPLLRWRVGGGRYIVALFGYPTIWLISIAIGGQLGLELETVGPILALLPLFLISLVAALPEEVAWRGFASPRLQARRSALTSSLIVGVLDLSILRAASSLSKGPKTSARG